MKYQIEQHQSQMDKASTEMQGLKTQKDESAKKVVMPLTNPNLNLTAPQVTFTSSSALAQ
eukprot:2608072-Rhodomonas_salina.1